MAAGVVVVVEVVDMSVVVLRNIVVGYAKHGGACS
jgi:hypothetical protein